MSTIGPPKSSDFLLEFPRAGYELLRWEVVQHLSFHHAYGSLPEGHGRPVLILPGFLSHNITMLPFYRVLNAKGYKVHFWDSNRLNTGFNEAETSALTRQLQKIASKEGKVSIIGHSWGGVLGLALSFKHPELVDRLVMLGSPIMGNRHPQSTFPGLRSLFIMLNGKNHPLLSTETSDALLRDPPVPVTAIYAAGDGIANWQASIGPSDKIKYFKVSSSHMGLPFNTDAIKISLRAISRPIEAEKRPATILDEQSRDMPAL